LRAPSKQIDLSAERVLDKEIVERHIKTRQQPIDMCQRAPTVAQ
jgi:hypothetical protein